MKQFLAAFLALLWASVIDSSACAAAQDDAAPLLVPYGDLNLSTQSGLKILDRRIEWALYQVCLDPHGHSSAGVIDGGCERDGRLAAQSQVAIAIAHQKSNKLKAEPQASIQIAKARP